MQMKDENFFLIYHVKSGGLPYNHTQSRTLCIGIFQKIENCGRGGGGCGIS
jgi:hypothetical protein